VTACEVLPTEQSTKTVKIKAGLSFVTCPLGRVFSEAKKC
jgi:hypothetical protein